MKAETKDRIILFLLRFIPHKTTKTYGTRDNMGHFHRELNGVLYYYPLEPDWKEGTLRNLGKAKYAIRILFI